MNPLDMIGPEFLRFYLIYGLSPGGVMRSSRTLIVRLPGARGRIFRFPIPALERLFRS
jgi:hypothetical protein